MATEFLMPKLGLTMEEGTIAEWLVANGQAVEAGAPVLRIETDKTETEVEAAASGRLHVVGEVGATYACGALIGWFLADGEPEPDPPSGAGANEAGLGAGSQSGSVPATHAGPATAGDRLLASPNARRIAAERGLDLRSISGTGPGGRIVSEDLAGAVAPTPSPAAAADRPPAPRSAPAAAVSAGAAVRPATAAARQLADLLGLDLTDVGVDPHDGRVTREAVARHVRERLAGDPAAPTRLPPARPAPAQTPARTIALTGMRGTIASRMHESLQQMAQLTLFMDADLDAVVADRHRRRDAGAAPSYTDYVIAAAARALVEHPRLNSQITDDGIAELPDVHVGMAVALDDGLIVPVVRDTPALDLATLAVETSRLAAAARAGSLTLADVEGATFAVTTLGMFDVDGFTPVINPPNAAILGVGRMRDDVVVDADGGVSTVTRATLSLTWDHRVLDGAPAAEFCRTVRDLLRRPTDLDHPRAPVT